MKTRVEDFLKRLSPKQMVGAALIVVLGIGAYLYFSKPEASLEMEVISESAGFELFDKNTWIKGEKELQVLAMRALKGQMEADLSAFEKIESARVLLDLPQQKRHALPKASVLLSLKKNCHLQEMDLRAVAHHVSGAVAHLDPEMVAISDTRGRLYHAIGAPLDFELPVEERIEMALQTGGITHELQCEKELLTLFVKPDAPFDEIRDLVCQIAPDKTLAIAFLPQEEPRHSGLISGVALTAILLAGTLFWFKRPKRPKEVIDFDKLACSIQDEDPRTLAVMLSHLEPHRAEQLISAFPPELSEHLLFHLGELEREEA